MAKYPDLIKMLERDAPKHFELVLPRPVEEIFPEEGNPIQSTHHNEALKKNYESLITTAFAGPL